MNNKSIFLIIFLASTCCKAIDTRAVFCGLAIASGSCITTSSVAHYYYTHRQRSKLLDTQGTRTTKTIMSKQEKLMLMAGVISGLTIATLGALAIGNAPAPIPHQPPVIPAPIIPLAPVPLPPAAPVIKPHSLSFKVAKTLYHLSGPVALALMIIPKLLPEPATWKLPPS